MNMFLKAIFISAVVFAAACAWQASDVGDDRPSQPVSVTKQPVLVELFTSEGCSSCPPADRNAAFLENSQPVPNADIITLAFHVNYWDGPQWKDQFSSPQYSERQTSYSQAFNLGEIYTPQMVVDGHAEFVGSDSGKATKAIADAANFTKGKIAISPDQDKFKIDVSQLAKHDDATVYLAVAEDKIRSDVRGGENAGGSFVHMSVVRELDPLGKIGGDTDNGTFQTTLSENKVWHPENVKYIAFVQENSSRKILAVAKFSR